MTKPIIALLFHLPKNRIVQSGLINVSILNGSNGFRLNGVRGDYDASVSNAGDINGDGFDDVIVGTTYSYAEVGYGYVVFGKASGFSAATDLPSLDGNNGFRLDQASTDRAFPCFVSSAGDVNGDGFDDVIIGAVGAYGYPNEFDGSGYVVFGKADGFDATMNLSSLNGDNGFRVMGIDSSDISVSNAGDVNGDGFDDVIVGAPLADSNGYRSGASYVVFGKASGFNAALDLSGLDGNDGFRVNGMATDDRLGMSVSNAGDVNGDGFDDVIIGAPGINSVDSCYIVFGKASGFAGELDLSSLDGSNGFRVDGENGFGGLANSVSSAGDVNGDGFSDIIVADYSSSWIVFGKASGFSATMDLSSLDGNNGFRINSGANSDRFGNSVSSAGDVNGDGFDDVIIGAFRSDDDTGSSYVMFGKASGFAAEMDVSSFDGKNGFRVNGTERNASLGTSVSGAGDVNKDGFADLIVSAKGASYVIFGGDFITGEAVYLGTPGDDNLVGTELAERFDAGNGNDSMDGLGGADIFQGGAGDDIIAVADLDFQQVDGGTGNDILKLTGGGINLDLANAHEIDGIEAIDLTGSGDNTLTLTLSDLIALSETTDTFAVNGNGGDRVAGLSDGWTDGGVDGDYRIFTNSGTTLRVHLAVRTDMPAPGVISLADLDGTNGFRMDGAEEFDQYGRFISDAGDVNGDGFDDVIIGAPFSSFSGINAGASYVIFGKASGFDATLDLTTLNGNNGFRVDGEVAFNRLGESVSSAGDVNGDGFDDVIVGACLAAPNGVYAAGSSYVVFGKASGFTAAMDLSSLDGSNGFRLDGTASNNRSGCSVSSAGDINGDGFDDVIVGADPIGLGTGSSYVVFGKANGFDAALNLSSLNGINGFRVDGPNSFGESVSSAGDVNGDGFDDLLVGAPSDGSFGRGSSVGYVVFGKASGFEATLALALDGSNGFLLEGGGPFYSLGESVSGAGDVNGDGFDDVIVGAPGADSNGIDSGSSYVVFGKASGFDATMNLSSLDGSNGFRLNGGAKRDFSGFSVSNAGDVNGDGFDDVIVGAYYADPIGSDSDAGSSYVVFGRASGFSAVLNLSDLDSSTGIRLDGAAVADHSGESVSSAGDVNGDGFDDLLVGAPDADPNGESSGSSYVIFGRSDFGGGQLPTIPGTSGDDVLRGTSAAEIFEAGDGNDVLIGGGGADMFRGGAGVDQIKIPDLNFESIDGGAGNDILHLAGADLNLDLTTSGDNIQGIETICLYGRGDNTLTLTADSLLALSDTSNTLTLHGNAGDRVTVQDDGWIDDGVKGFYHTYTNDDAVLLVGANLAIDFIA